MSSLFGNQAGTGSVPRRGLGTGGGFGGGGFGAGGFGGGGSTTSGAVIAEVVTSSPAQEAGLAGGDIITAVDGKSVTSPDQLSNDISQYHPGNKVTFTYTDGSGNTQTATAQLTSGPPQ